MRALSTWDFTVETFPFSRSLPLGPLALPRLTAEIADHMVLPVIIFICISGRGWPPSWEALMKVLNC